MPIKQGRRKIPAGGLSDVGTGLLGAPHGLGPDGPPETTTIRRGYWPRYACVAPHSIAEGLPRAEGFTDLQPAHGSSVARGAYHVELQSTAWVVAQLDAGGPITAIAGIHIGCCELFMHEPIRAVADLKGRQGGIDPLGSSLHMCLSILAAQIGLGDDKDIARVAFPDADLVAPLAEGRVDAILGFATEPQELRARGIGRAILNTAWDAPSSHYFCCSAFGRSQFLRDYPNASKRYLRAVGKAADLCAASALAARRLVDEECAADNDYVFQTLSGVPYDRWREYDPEDPLRFFALRLHEVGMVGSSPNRIIAEGTDWRSLNELKRGPRA